MIRRILQQRHYKLLVYVLALFFCASCGNDPIPKPKAYLSLDYPEAKYLNTDVGLPFSFDKNELAKNVVLKKFNGTTNSYGINLEYPTLKGTIYLTYKTVISHEQLIDYIRDAQNFTQEHTKKADQIIEQPFEDSNRKAYGMFYEVGGNAASQSQFYVTDSISHFLIGSLYFYAKPNYDSILPAAHYLKKDIKRIMETVEWK